VQQTSGRVAVGFGLLLPTVYRAECWYSVRTLQSAGGSVWFIQLYEDAEEEKIMRGRKRTENERAWRIENKRRAKKRNGKKEGQ
jgi:hypothetical protein